MSGFGGGNGRFDYIAHVHEVTGLLAVTVNLHGKPPPHSLRKHGDNAALAASVNLAGSTAGTSGLVCFQTLVNQVDCTLSIDTSGDLTVNATDNVGNPAVPVTESGYVIDLLTYASGKEGESGLRRYCREIFSVPRKSGYSLKNLISGAISSKPFSRDTLRFKPKLSARSV